MLTAQEVADYFLARAEQAGESLRLDELQMLCFYAQATQLAVLLEPMFGDDLVIGERGPVVRTLLDRYLGCGESPLPPPLSVSADAYRHVGHRLDDLYDEREALAAAFERWGGCEHEQQGRAMRDDEIRAAFLAYAREVVGPAPPPPTADEWERLLHDEEFLARVRERVALVDSGRPNPGR